MSRTHCLFGVQQKQLFKNTTRLSTAKKRKAVSDLPI